MCACRWRRGAGDDEVGLCAVFGRLKHISGRLWMMERYSCGFCGRSLAHLREFRSANAPNYGLTARTPWMPFDVSGFMVKPRLNSVVWNREMWSLHWIVQPHPFHAHRRALRINVSRVAQCAVSEKRGNVAFVVTPIRDGAKEKKQSQRISRGVPLCGRLSLDVCVMRVACSHENIVCGHGAAASARILGVYWEYIEPYTWETHSADQWPKQLHYKLRSA